MLYQFKSTKQNNIEPDFVKDNLHFVGIHTALCRIFFICSNIKMHSFYSLIFQFILLIANFFSVLFYINIDKLYGGRYYDKSNTPYNHITFFPLKFFWTSNFWDEILLFLPKSYFGSETIFLSQNIFGRKNIFWTRKFVGLKISFGQKILPLKFLFYAKFFLTQRFFI